MGVHYLKKDVEITIGKCIRSISGNDNTGHDNIRNLYTPGEGCVCVCVCMYVCMCLTLSLSLYIYIYIYCVRLGLQNIPTASLQRGKNPTMILNNLMVRFRYCWSFGECRLHLYCHRSQIHSGR